jgi:hypothetical protein
MTRRSRLVVACGVVAGLACGAPALAQTGTVIAPSFAVGAGYDTNVFWLPTTSNMLRTDSLWRFTPGLAVRHTDSHDVWGGSYSFDAERYQNHPDLTTPFARQSAAIYDHVTMSPLTKWALDAHFDSTLSPSDLNLTTGIVIGRVRASRWGGETSISHDVSPRVELDGGYRVSLDRLDASVFEIESRVLTNAAEGGVKIRVTPRNDFTATGQTERFDFAEGPSIVSNAALAGWAVRLTPATTFTIKGGPRWSLGRITPDIDATLIRRQGPSEASLTYARTETTAIGLPGVVQVQRLMAAGIYRRPGSFEMSVEGGGFDNSQRLTVTSAPLDTRVYHVGAHVTVPIGSLVSIQSTYGLDWQQGVVPIVAPLTLTPFAGSGATVNRQVVFVQFVISRSLEPLPKSKQAVGDSIRRP